MKFLIGLLFGIGLSFGWYYLYGASQEELRQEKDKAKAAVEEVKKADAEMLASVVNNEKAKIQADFEVQLKTASDQIEVLNKELIDTSRKLAAAKETIMTNPVEITTVKKPESKPPAKVPAAVAVPRLSLPQAAPAPAHVYEPVKTAPASSKKSSFSGPKPAHGRKSDKYRLQKKMDGTVITNYY